MLIIIMAAITEPPIPSKSSVTIIESTKSDTPIPKATEIIVPDKIIIPVSRYLESTISVLVTGIDRAYLSHLAISSQENDVITIIVAISTIIPVKKETFFWIIPLTEKNNPKNSRVLEYLNKLYKSFRIKPFILALL